jgi:hypothetical protein
MVEFLQQDIAERADLTQSLQALASHGVLLASSYLCQTIYLTTLSYYLHLQDYAQVQPLLMRLIHLHSMDSCSQFYLHYLLGFGMREQLRLM